MSVLMKDTLIVAAASLLVLSTIPAMSQLPDDENWEPPSLPCGDASEVTVEVVEEPLPTDEEELRAYLWNNYITGPDQGLFECPVRDSDRLNDAFTASLIAKVREASLDSEAFERCLEAADWDSAGRERLPVAARYVTFDGKPAWLILLKWERTDASLREVLGHCRVYVLDERDATILAFETCD